jgi:hypothetical protein
MTMAIVLFEADGPRDVTIKMTRQELAELYSDLPARHDLTETGKVVKDAAVAMGLVS